MHKKINVTEKTNKRLDAYLAAKLAGHTRSFFKRLILDEKVLLNGQVCKPAQKLVVGDQLTIQIPEKKTYQAVAEKIALNILYEDDYLVVVNKPQGMVMYPSRSHESHTLANALLYHFKELSTVAGEQRPGIVHRLDKDTSGALLVAKTNEVHLALNQQMKNREIDRVYLALCHGNIKENEGIIKAEVGRNPRNRTTMAVVPEGRKALTRYCVLKRYGTYTLTEFSLETGRKHQIRVHARYIGHPIAGDTVYTKLSNPFGLRGQFLHAKKIKFVHPITHKVHTVFAPLSNVFVDILRKLSLDAEE